MTQFAFYFDAASCSGCKACQAACKDKNHLPVGVLWRRVYEVSGGGWKQAGRAWISNVYAYHVSLSCNHCDRPICLEVCPANAYSRRLDGIVLLNSERCIGCRYCLWACPYGAPQFDEESGRTSKCDFCVDQLDEGKPPVCVAACPMRALDFGEHLELENKYGALEPFFPLPTSDLTRPSLVFTPHQAAYRSEMGTGRVINWEEVVNQPEG